GLAVVRVDRRIRTPARGIVAVENLVHDLQIPLDISDKDRAIQHVIAERFADLAFASAGDGAGFVADGAFPACPDDAPAWRTGMLLHADLESGWGHINLAGGQFDRVLLAIIFPPDLLPSNAGARAFGDVNQIREIPVNRITFRPHVHPRAVILDHVHERPSVAAHRVGDELVSEAVARIRDRPAGVFFLDIAHQVGRVADLRLYF